MEFAYGIIEILIGTVIMEFARQLLLGADSQTDILPIVIILAFTLLGLALIVVGIRNIFSQIATRTKGIETYAIVVACDTIKGSDRRSGARHHLTRAMVMEADGKVGEYNEYSVWGHQIGSFLKVKHYKNNIHILDSVRAKEVPYHIRSVLESRYVAHGGKFD